MDKLRMIKIITEAEGEIATLDQALDSGNDNAAQWTQVILSGMIQDLRRLAEEEPTPDEFDKQKLSAAFQTALSAVGEGRVSIKESEYRLKRSDAAALSLALYDVRELIKTTPMS
jgi:hypothetical protein